MKLPAYGTTCQILEIALLLGEDGKPRVAPGAQRTLGLSSWRAKVGPWNAQKIGIIRVTLINGVYYVSDGQHRVADLVDRGFTHVRAEVGEQADYAGAAADFLGRNTGKMVTRRVKTEVGITSGDPTWMDILSIVEKAGFTRRTSQSNNREKGSSFHILQGDTTLEKLHAEGTLADVLAIYASLGPEWAASAARPSAFLRHLGSALKAHPTLLAKNGEILVTRLKRKTLVKREKEFNAIIAATGCTIATAYVWGIVDAWNTRLGSQSSEEQHPQYVTKRNYYQ